MIPKGPFTLPLVIVIPKRLCLTGKRLEKDRFLLRISLRNGTPTHCLASTAIGKEPLFGIANANAIAKAV